MPRFLTLDALYAQRGQAEILRLAGVVDGNPNLDRITAAIASAEAEAISYLGGRYGELLPTTPETTPSILQVQLAKLSHRYLAGTTQVSPTLQADADDARTWLRSVSRGTADLGLAAAPTVDRGGAKILVSVDLERSALTFESLSDM